MTMLIDICNGPRYISDRLRVHIARCRLLAFRFSALAAPLRQLRCGGKRSVAAAAPIISERRAAPRGVAELARRAAHMQRRLRAVLCACADVRLRLLTNWTTHSASLHSTMLVAWGVKLPRTSCAAASAAPRRAQCDCYVVRAGAAVSYGWRAASHGAANACGHKLGV